MPTDQAPTRRARLAALIRAYRDRRLGVIFVLGMASGFPWVLIGSAMSAWLEELGVSRTEIGFIGAVAAMYALNFLWAPLLDRFRPWLFGRLGLRRGWILLAQCILLVLTFSISLVDPASHLLLIGALLLGIAFASASQDVAIDAYRVELIERSDQARISYGAAMATSGWWTGYGLLGALPFWLVDSLPGGWGTVYRGLALVWLGFIAFVLLLAPMPTARRAEKLGDDRGAWRRLRDTVVAPLADFFRRNGVALAVSILLFVLTFKIGEAFLGRMSIVFYKEIGFSNAQVGTYSKLINWWVTVVFAVIGSVINARFGILRGLVVGGIAMASTNLMFAWMAVAGPETWLFALTVIVDGFTAALGTVAFMAFITTLTSHTFSATQYALLASIGNLGRTTLSSSSGWVVDRLDGNWALFFVLTALAIVPSLLLLRWLGPALRSRYPEAFDRRPPPSAR